MHSSTQFAAFNAGAALSKSRLLPVRAVDTSFPLTCSNCRFVNHTHYNYCINCGYPVHPNSDRLALYNYRLGKRKELQKSCIVKIKRARNALYFLGGCCLLGVFYLFSDWKVSVIKGIIMVCLGIIFTGLGRWSVQKPFTSLLISLITLVTFIAINTWAELASAFTTAAGIYVLLIQIGLAWFLLEGVKGAFHADILEEEFKL